MAWVDCLGAGRKRRLTDAERHTVLAPVATPSPGRLSHDARGEVAAQDEERAAYWTLDAVTAVTRARTAVVRLSTDPSRDATTGCGDELGPVIPRIFPPTPGWSSDAYRTKAPLDDRHGPETTWVSGALRVRDGQALNSPPIAVRSASPLGSPTAGRNPGSGVDRHVRLAIVIAPLYTAFEERSSSTAGSLRRLQALGNRLRPSSDRLAQHGQILFRHLTQDQRKHRVHQGAECDQEG